MKRINILVLLISTFLTACNFPAPTTPAANNDSALAQNKAANSTTIPPIHITAQPTDLINQEATPESQPDQLNVATVIANLEPLFSLAQVLGMAHLENDLLLVTIEVPGESRGIITPLWETSISIVRFCLNIPITSIATANALMKGNTCY